MDGVGDEFLAHAALAREQRRTFHRGDLADRLHNLEERRGPAHHAATGAPLLQGLAQPLIFHDELLGLQGLAHHLAQLAHAEIFGDEVVDAPLKGGHGFIHGGVAGDHDGDGLGAQDAQGPEKLGAHHVRQLQVNDGQVHFVPPHRLQGRGPGARHMDLVAQLLQARGQRLPGGGVVVND